MKVADENSIVGEYKFFPRPFDGDACRGIGFQSFSWVSDRCLLNDFIYAGSLKTCDDLTRVLSATSLAADWHG